MADFSRLTPKQRKWARRFLIIPGWLVAGSRYPIHFAATHPIRSAALAYAAAGEPGAPNGSRSTSRSTSTSRRGSRRTCSGLPTSARQGGKDGTVAVAGQHAVGHPRRAPRAGRPGGRRLREPARRGSVAHREPARSAAPRARTRRPTRRRSSATSSGSRRAEKFVQDLISPAEEPVAPTPRTRPPRPPRSASSASSRSACRAASPGRRRRGRRADPSRSSGSGRRSPRR
jgi:hypothetical protein